MEENLSTKRCVGARCDCACWMAPAIRASVLSAASAVACASTKPSVTIVPARMVSPMAFSTGRLSPVTGDSSSAARPLTMRASTGTRLPVRTRRRAPTKTLSTATSRQPPAPSANSAVSGAMAVRARTASRARTSARASMASATANRKITMAASAHLPISSAPMTATAIRKLILNVSARTAIQPLRSVGPPANAMEASANANTGQA